MENYSSLISMLFLGIVSGAFFFMYKRRLSSMQAAAGVNAPIPDASLGGEEVVALSRDLKRGDLMPFRRRLEVARRGAWDDRDFLVGLLAKRIDRKQLDAWVQEDPSGLPLLVRGVARINDAFDARGHDSASRTADKRLKAFGALMEQAQADLLASAGLDPEDPTPWAYLVTTARGTSVSRVMVRQWFDQAISRDPANYSAHNHMLTELTQKWHGSHEQCLAFAREATANLPDGCDLHAALVMKAHLERWLFFSQMEKNKSGAQRYLQAAEVRDECVRAYERSLGAAHPQPRRSTAYARNIAAMWFYLTKDKERCRAEIMRIGGAVADTPWMWLNGYQPGEAYMDANRFANGIF